MVGRSTVCPYCGSKCKSGFSYCPSCSAPLGNAPVKEEVPEEQTTVIETFDANVNSDDYQRKIKLPCFLLVVYSLVGFVFGVAMVFVTVPFMTELHNQHASDWTSFLKSLGVGSSQELQLYLMLIGIVALISAIFAAFTYMTLKKRKRTASSIMSSLMMAVTWLIFLVFAPSGIHDEILIVFIAVLAFSILIDIAVYSASRPADV